MAKVRKRNGKFVFDYRIGGVRDRMTLPTRDEANELCEQFNRLKRAKKLEEFEKLLSARHAIDLAGLAMSGKTLGEVIREYASTCTALKSKQTQKNEMADFTNIYNFLHKEKDVYYLREVTPQLLEEYQGRLLKTVSNSTCNRRYTTFKHFFNKCVEWKYLSESPAKGIRKKKETPNPRKTFTDLEVTAIADALQPYLRNPFLVFAMCGLRPGEGMSPRFKDWDRVTGTLVVYCDKGANGSRVVHLPELAQAILQDVQSERLVKPQDCIFLNTRNRPLKVAVLTRGVRKVVEKLGLEIGKTPYGLRHTYATKLSRMNVSSAKTQKLMGHQSIRTTENYYKLDDRDMRLTVDEVAKVFDFSTGKEVGSVTGGHQAG